MTFDKWTHHVDKNSERYEANIPGFGVVCIEKQLINNIWSIHGGYDFLFSIDRFFLYSIWPTAEEAHEALVNFITILAKQTNDALSFLQGK